MRYNKLATAAIMCLSSITATAERPVVTEQSGALPGKPTFGTYGFDEAGMDRTVQPGNDFYDYANGRWAKETQIPADKSSYGAFNVLDDLSRERTRAILEKARKDPSSKIGAAYVSYLDEAGVQARGLAPITPWLDEIRKLADKKGYAVLVAKAARQGIGGPIRASVGQDDKDPEAYILAVRQSGLGLPDRDFISIPPRRWRQSAQPMQAI